MRARPLDRHPRAVLIAIAAASTAVHTALSLLVRSPLFTPDEWLYADLSRSILAGHPGEVTGGHISVWSTISYVGPAITSPLWLIHNVDLAYHLSLAVASLAFALAVFPAYALARKVGLATSAALVAALFSQLIPAGAFTSTLLAEPYAYPAVLVGMLIAIEAIANPGFLRVGAVGVTSAMLCVIAGMQFLIFPIAVVVTWIACSTSWRGRVLRGVIAVAGTVFAIGVVQLAGNATLFTRIEGLLEQHHPVGQLASWLGVNVFVLGLATGWVVVPVAAVGLGRMLCDQDASSKTFAWLSLSLIAGMLAEAALWGANGNGLYERFTFYAAPLLVIGFLHELSHRHAAGRLPYALVGYAAAIAAILTPLTSYLVNNTGNSPTMLGLTDHHALRIAWPIAAALLALVAAGVGAAKVRLLVPLGAVVLTVLAGVSFGTLIHYQTTRAPEVGASSQAVLLVDAIQPDYSKSAMRMLFWNPHIDRIVVMGRGGVPDLPAAVGGELRLGTAIATSPGGQVRGPFVVPDDVAAWRRGRELADGNATQLAETPDVVVFGWTPGGLLLPVTNVLVAGDARRTRRWAVRISSLGHSLRLLVDCATRKSNPRAIDVPHAGSARLVISVPRGGSQDCRLSVAPGRRTVFNLRTPIVHARLVSS